MGPPEHIKVGVNSSLSGTASGSFALAGHGELETENLHTNIAQRVDGRSQHRLEVHPSQTPVTLLTSISIGDSKAHASMCLE